MSEPDPATIAATLFAQEGTGAAWGLTIEAVAEGYARVSMQVRADMLNGHGTIHGGMIFALADTAFAYACNSRNVRSVAQGASIVFLAPAMLGDTIVAEARERALADRNGVYEVALTTADGRPVAQFQGQSRAIGGRVIDSA